MACTCEGQGFAIFKPSVRKPISWRCFRLPLLGTVIDVGLHYVLSGCRSLRKLEIMDCPFGGKPLLTNAAKLETMRSLWMSNCPVSLGECKLLAKNMPGLNVEVINEGKLEPRESWPDDCPVEKLYIYRTIAGQRLNMPHYVWIVYFWGIIARMVPLLFLKKKKLCMDSIRLPSNPARGFVSRRYWLNWQLRFSSQKFRSRELRESGVDSSGR